MGQTIELSAADGHRLDAWEVRPDGAPRGGLVILQEIFGVNAHIRSVAESYAADGWTALAPALFDRVRRGVELDYGPDDIEAGKQVMAKIPIETALIDVGAAIAALEATGLKVGVVGYCWGGTLAWAAACRLGGLSAAVSYYGGGVPAMAAEQPNCPVQLHFGEEDPAIPMDGVETVRAA
ncbi:MAG: dienelactone hydrolase family protein, partial [Alphaproteobacteria bacterium]|nr:dienelactone hydrolase family protein [Alphaproteobacteria bacterium]